MNRHSPIPVIIITCMALLLGACNLPSTYAPTLPPQVTTDSGNPEYTAAAGTISAQLTEIAIPVTSQPTPADIELDTPTSEGAEETEPAGTDLPPADPTNDGMLPATSTPLPTRTPLPSETPQPTNTRPPSATPTSTKSPTPTEVVSDPKELLNLGAPSWQDNFETSANWPLYSDEHVSMRITAENILQMTALNADKWESWMLTWPVLKNFYIEVVATPLQCTGLDRFGLLARAGEDAKSGYLFGFTCDGRYSYRSWDGEGFTMLTPWTPTELIEKGPEITHRMGLLVEGNIFTLYDNGELLIRVVDENNTFEEGLVGLFVGSVNTPSFTVQFTEVSFWELP